MNLLKTNLLYISFSRYSSRVNYDVACAMDFHRYPVDEQTCEIKFESFGYTSQQVCSQIKPYQIKNVDLRNS